MARPTQIHTDESDQGWLDLLTLIEMGSMTRGEACAQFGITRQTLWRRLARARELREAQAQPDHDAPLLRPVFAPGTIPLAQQTCDHIHPDAQAPHNPKCCCMVCNRSKQDWRWDGLSKVPSDDPKDGDEERPVPKDDGAVFTLPPKDAPGLKGGTK
jgi:hypothetical protein